MQARASARTLAVLTASALGACGDAPSAPGTRDRGPIVPTWEWSGMSGHIGVQLNGRHGEERTLLELAFELEQVQPFIRLDQR